MSLIVIRTCCTSKQPLLTKVPTLTIVFQVFQWKCGDIMLTQKDTLILLLREIWYCILQLCYHSWEAYLNVTQAFELRPAVQVHHIHHIHNWTNSIHLNPLGFLPGEQVRTFKKWWHEDTAHALCCIHADYADLLGHGQNAARAAPRTEPNDSMWKLTQFQQFQGTGCEYIEESRNKKTTWE